MGSQFQNGKRYVTETDGLRVLVQVEQGQWSYRIIRLADGETLADKTPLWPWDQTDDAAKIVAIERALQLLNRPGEDASAVAKQLSWKTYVNTPLI
jgi:hypothetical protein